jgi:hypothetical protein
MVPVLLDTMAAAVEPPIHDVALVVEAPLDPVAAPVQVLGGDRMAPLRGVLRSAIQAPVDAGAGAVQLPVDDVATAIQVALGAVARVGHDLRAGQQSRQADADDQFAHDVLAVIDGFNGYNAPAANRLTAARQIRGAGSFL